MLQLTRPLVFLDLETTGLDKENDRIVQICLHRIMPGFGHGDVETWLVNPEIPIPAKSTEIHGITDEMVKDSPTFSEIAGEVFEFLIGCDLAGFNSNYFDIPLLYNELLRVGIVLDYKSFNMIDVGTLFKIQEPRDLAKAVEFYCGRDMKNAHDATVDVAETVNVFLAQLMRYPDLPRTVEQLALYTNYGQAMADISGKFAYNPEGVLLLNFGKYKGQPAATHLDFVHWMYFKANFPPDTNAICEDLLDIGRTPSQNDELPW